LKVRQFVDGSAKHPVQRGCIGAKFDCHEGRRIGIGGATEILHDRAMHRDTLGCQHAFQLISGMKSLQHGQTGGSADTRLVRLLAVLVPDGAYHGTGDFLGKCRTKRQQWRVGSVWILGWEQGRHC
jgi:hypothetical protein